MSDYKQWLDNEYSQWVKALQESTVHNFKEHPMVKRMLGEPELFPVNKKDFPIDTLRMIIDIDEIGRAQPLGYCSNAGIRMVYYAQQILKSNPSSICEIGGGVGQFYAILRALGYKGTYIIYDIPAIMKFQFEYLAEVSKQTGLDLSISKWEEDFIVSFYALGEFDDERKEFYLEFTDKAKHGYIAFNPHSGASDDTYFLPDNISITPGIEPGVSIITW